MKRYRITILPSSVVEGSLTTAGHCREDENGKWVKYEDVQTLLQSFLMLNTDGGVRVQVVEDTDLCEFVPDPEFLKEIMK